MRDFKSLLIHFLAFLLFVSTPILVHAQFRLDGQFRPRTEYRNGYRVLRGENTDPAFFVSQRSRLSLMYQNDLYKMKISGQDVRVWGDVAQLQDNANINIHEAWAQVNLSNSLGVKIGRQELIYDDQRLLGSVNWTQQARSHDALVLKYHNVDSHFNLNVGTAYNQQAENLLGNVYRLSNYKVLSYVWLNKDFDNFSVSALGLSDGFQLNDAVNYRYTYGVYLTYDIGSWKFSGSGYQQDGDDASRRNINARMFAVKAVHTGKVLNLTAGFDYLSGGAATDAKPARHTFNTLYATNHKFYGNMDYFLNIPNDTQGGGLQDLHVGALYKISNKSELGLTYHHFALANEIEDPGLPGYILKQNLGSEFDLSFSQKFSDDMTFKLGYSSMIPSSTLGSIQNRPDDQLQHWGWAMMILTPQFFTE